MDKVFLRIFFLYIFFQINESKTIFLQNNYLSYEKMYVF